MCSCASIGMGRIVKACLFGFRRSIERICIGRYDGWGRIFALVLQLIFLTPRFLEEKIQNVLIFVDSDWALQYPRNVVF